MSDYKRLTKWEIPNCASVNGCSPIDKDFANAINRLAELEDKLENGTLVELPCKVGDTVYWVVRDYDWNGKAQGFIIEQGKFRYACLDYWNFSCFLTKAEAEAEIERIERERLDLYHLWHGRKC